ncbi:MAG: Gfo/Idh/MocA family oxidoreductase [Candidatus Omnitrophica bacterium]|nr:Gfo/Idh/MocA family oxidoreductase [Candidatus Omnitrophota bacterium]HPO99573.1 Gfo/Idh/MocA family oxidoreductase [bacterium]
MKSMDRRTFVKGAAGAWAAGQLIGTSRSWAGANDTIRVAVLGVHGRGQDHIQAHQAEPNVEVVALCDPDRKVLTSRAAQFKEKYGKEVKTAVDLRDLFADGSIDAVSIATPNHWHALATIWACQAGKDVYVEKPGSHNIFEGRKMIEAAYKYRRIVQHGVQLRSSPALQEAVQLLRDGIIGNVYLARGLCFRTRPSIGKKPTTWVPEHLDYDLWLGPAQWRPYSENIVHYNWHWHWDFGNGDVGNQGVHETDMCLWGLGVKTLPDQVCAMGGKFLWDDDKETPEWLSTNYKFTQENKMIQFETRPWITNDEAGAGVGNIFYGEEGFMVIKGYGTYETYLGKDKKPGPRRSEEGNHFANFHKAVRSRNMADQNGPVETIHLSSAIAHLGNIAYLTGATLQFDPRTERFINNEEANRYLSRKYREPFVVPEIV